jgi:8-oxo-dGTP pyrophosphatase MutT (NUDIX family)
MTVLVKSNDIHQDVLIKGDTNGSDDIAFKRRPITSYGIVLFTVKDKVILYQLCKPRDSVNYASFMRGLYNKKQLTFFLSLMTHDELHRIKTYEFDTLWDDLWYNKEFFLYTSDYKKAKKKFDDNHEMVLEMINSISTVYNEDHLWGFPKGKRNTNEKYVQAALREFKEETGIDPDTISIVSDIPLVETYYGSNSKLYKTVYFPAMSPTVVTSKDSYTNSDIRELKTVVSNEIEKTVWCTYEETLEKFNSRPYRQRMIKVLHKCIYDQLKDYCE